MHAFAFYPPITTTVTPEGTNNGNDSHHSRSRLLGCESRCLHAAPKLLYRLFISAVQRSLRMKIENKQIHCDFNYPNYALTRVRSMSTMAENNERCPPSPVVVRGIVNR